MKRLRSEGEIALRDCFKAFFTGHLQSDALEPVLLAMFGDHVEITVTAEQISINEYSSD